MNWLKGLALAATLAAVPAFAGPAVAEVPAASTTASDKLVVAAADDDATMRAKAVDCSKQADAKKLHGETRKKFREACKRGK